MTIRPLLAAFSMIVLTQLPALASAPDAGASPVAVSAEYALSGINRGTQAYVPFVSPADVAAISSRGISPTALSGSEPGESEAAFTPGRTDLVSVASDGSPAEGHSGPSYISGDGRYVAFLSDAPNLVPGDNNGVVDVFVRDRVAGTTEIVSVASDGGIAEGIFGVLGSYWPSMSADGRYVAFMSYAANLVPGDTNQATDIFVRDRLTNSTERVSVGDDESEATGPGFPGAATNIHPAISDDGRFVAFATTAPNLLGAGTSSTNQIVLRDRMAGTTTLVSKTAGGVPAGGFSQLPNVSSDGRFVTFQTSATNLATGDNNGWSDVYVHDTIAGTTERVSFAADGGNPNDQTSILNQPDVSDDGRFVSFVSRATNLVPGDSSGAGDTLGGFDLFVRDMQLDRTQRVSVAGDGAEAKGGSSGGLSGTMSTDGRFFVFDTLAANLIAGDENKQPDVFVHDRLAGANQLVSRNSAGNQSNSSSSFSNGSADGRHVAFTSYANNLAPGGLESYFDVFAHDLGPTVGVGGVNVQPKGSGLDVSGWVNFEGGVFVSGTDPAGDTTDGGMSGSDLVAAGIAYRPRTADLLFSWSTASLPSVAMPAPPEVGTLVPGATASVAVPPVAFTTSFRTTGFNGVVETWQVRASGTSVSPVFGLYLCAPSCSRIDTPTGGIGIAGHEVRVRVPVTSSLFNTSAGDELAGVRAFVSPLAAEVPSQPDSIDLGTVVIPTPEVSLGWGPKDAGPGQVDYAYPSLIVGNRFEASLGVPPGQGDRLWIRACLHAECSAHSRAVV